MRRFARQALLVTLIALHGGVTSFGPALHALPGFNHAAAPLTDPTGGTDNQAARLLNSHNDCPICHFLAHGQILDDPDRCGRFEVVQVRPADEIPLIVPPDLSRPSHPRAPPLALS